MPKHSKTEVGLKTDVLYDNEINSYKRQDKFYNTKKIEVYHSMNGIHGFFCFFNNFIDEKFKQNKFYQDFQEKHLKTLQAAKLPLYKKEIIDFQEKEFILNLIVHYDEDTKMITAMKIKTNFRVLSFGNKPNINNKPIETIHRDQYFLTGFYSCFFLEKGIPHLSYLSGYFEDYDSVNNYFEQELPSQFILFFMKFWKSFLSISSLVLRKFINIFLIIFPLLYLYYSSQTLISGEYAAKGLISQPVYIHTDEHGFAHIKANSIEDSYFGLGYAHAKDRLWQMEFNRRLARGRLSEVFGSKTFGLDKMLRQLGINNGAKRDAEYYKKDIFSINYKYFTKY